MLGKYWFLQLYQFNNRQILALCWGNPSLGWDNIYFPNLSSLMLGKSLLYTGNFLFSTRVPPVTFTVLMKWDCYPSILLHLPSPMNSSYYELVRVIYVCFVVLIQDSMDIGEMCPGRGEKPKNFWHRHCLYRSQFFLTK